MKCFWVLLFCLGVGVAGAQELKIGYYPDGRIRYRGYFADGKPTGEMTRYYPDGRVQATMTHRGDTTDVVLYSKKGEYTSVGRYVAQKKEGDWKHYRGERLLVFEQYASDCLNGLTIRYFASGNEAEEKNWSRGKPEGEWKLYYDNHKIRLQAFYADGSLNGTVRSYGLNGILRAEGNYQKGYKEGEWSFFDEQGKLEKKILYRLGRPEEAEERESEQSRQLDALLDAGKKIPDPAVFIDDPDAYMRLTGME